MLGPHSSAVAEAGYQPANVRSPDGTSKLPIDGYILAFFLEIYNRNSDFVPGNKPHFPGNKGGQTTLHLSPGETTYVDDGSGTKFRDYDIRVQDNGNDLTPSLGPL